MMKQDQNVIVFGSINIDLVVKVPRLPVAGETLLGSEFFTASGGKGANQAVAVAKLGVPTQMVGRVGGDSFGGELIECLKSSGVLTAHILIDRTASSGIAAIAVNNTGENQIIVIPGVNGNINQTDVERLKQLLPNASALLLQFEIPIDAVIAAAQVAHQAGVTVILDPAPAQIVPEQLYPLIDIITPNQTEAEQLVGFTVNTPEDAAKAANILRERGVKTVIVKLGAQGALCATNDETFLIPAFPVVAVDTVAAGDAFNGGLAAALFEGLSLRQAVIWGAAAGAIACTKPGAQSAMGSRDTLNTFLQQRT